MPGHASRFIFRSSAAKRGSARMGSRNQYEAQVDPREAGRWHVRLSGHGVKPLEQRAKLDRVAAQGQRVAEPAQHHRCAAPQFGCLAKGGDGFVEPAAHAERPPHHHVSGSAVGLEPRARRIPGTNRNRRVRRRRARTAGPAGSRPRTAASPSENRQDCPSGSGGDPGTPHGRELHVDDVIESAARVLGRRGRPLPGRPRARWRTGRASECRTVARTRASDRVSGSAAP